MRMLIMATCVAVLSVAPGAAPAAENGVTDDGIAQLEALGRIWGAARYFHPAIYQGEIDWDTAGEEAIEAALRSPEPAAFRRTVEELLARLDDPQSRVGTGVAQETPSADPRYSAQSEVTVERVGEDVAVIRANDWNGITGGADAVALLTSDFFAAAVEEIGDTPLLVVDLRRFDAPRPGLDIGGFAIARALEPFAQRVSSVDLLLPAAMQILHSGFANERWRTENYYTARIERMHKPLAQSGAAPDDRFVVFLFNQHGGFVIPYANAFAAAGIGAAVVEGDMPAAGGTLPISVALPGDAGTATVGTSLLKNADGSVGPMVSDRLPAPSEAGETDAALERALEIVRARAASKPQGVGAGAFTQIFDRAYPEQTEPTPAQRVLAAYKLWNAIHYFFPYKDLMDGDWDPVLKAALPDFLAAGDDIAYAKALARMAAQAQDTHIGVRAPGYDKFLGIHAPNLATILVEDDVLIVKEVIDAALNETGRVQTGDIITHIDGEAVDQRLARFKPYVPASTPGSYKLRLEQRLLAGEDGSSVSLTLRRRGERRPIDIVLTRDTPFFAPTMTADGLGRRDHPKMELLDGDIAYFNIGRMTAADDPAAHELLFRSKGAIVDMRGYPNGGGFSLVRAFAEERTPSATIVESFVFQAADVSPAWKTQLQYAEPGARHYPHPVVLLVNHMGMSAAEHFSMLIKSAGGERVTIVGSPTNGANGVITEVNLPGAARVTFTGMQAAWGDGARLQRRGVVPDVRVAPTVKSVRAGRDHVFDTALKTLKRKIKDQK